MLFVCATRGCDVLNEETIASIAGKAQVRATNCSLHPRRERSSVPVTVHYGVFLALWIPRIQIKGLSLEYPLAMCPASMECLCVLSRNTCG